MQKENRFFEGHHVRRCRIFRPKSSEDQKKRSSFDSDFFVFIPLSRESDGGAMRRTNPDSLRGCLRFRIFRLKFASDFFDLLLVRFHQAEMIVVKHLILGRNNEVGWELSLAIMAEVKTTLRITWPRCRHVCRRPFFRPKFKKKDYRVREL